MARIVIELAPIPLMSPLSPLTPTAFISRNSAGKMVAAARMFCCKSIRWVWAT